MAVYSAYILEKLWHEGIWITRVLLFCWFIPAICLGVVLGIALWLVCNFFMALWQLPLPVVTYIFNLVKKKNKGTGCR